MSPFQRTGRKIKLNHSNALPRYILTVYVHAEKVYETEDRKLWHWRFVSADLCSGRLRDGKVSARANRSFSTAVELWEAIYAFTASNYTTWLVGHNVLSQLILTGLPHRFQYAELHIDRPRSKRQREDNDTDNVHAASLAVLEAPPTIIGCRVVRTEGRLVIVDTLNWFPGTISDLLSSIGFRAAENDPLGNPSNGSGPATSCYAEQLHKIFENLIYWVRDNNMGLFRYTASGQAFGAYRHRFMDHQIYAHDNCPVQKQERKAYFGGRSEMFRRGPFDDTTYQLDCNALFPSVMYSGCFPCLLSRYEERQSLLGILPTIDWSASCADVEICTTKPLYPLRTKLHIVYPIGTFRTHLCGEELYRAFKNGCIRRCGSWSEYKMAPIFRLWVEELWAMRQKYKADGNKLYEQFTKRIMNSLYGKWAQLTPSWENVPTDWTMLPFTTDSRRDYATGEWSTLRAVGWQTQKLCKRTEKPGSFYAIAAFVTSAARCRMDYLRLVAGHKNCYYQGVDSIICNKRGLINLDDNGEIHPTELGKLRLEYESDIGRIDGISDYQIGTKIVVSSRTLNAETNDLGDIMQHKYYVMDSLFKNGPIDTLPQRMQAWQRSNGYAKGTVQPDGWVAPFELGGSPMSELLASSPELAAMVDSSSAMP